MKYNTVEIRPNIGRTNWEYYFRTNPGERVAKRESLNEMGFFHFEETRDKEEAFNMLKNVMIRRHEEEIFKLQKSLDKLKKLKYKKEEK